MRFAKMQGVGNDFVVLSGRDTEGLNLPTLAVTLCARHSSIGADGLLVIGAPPDENSAFSFRMFNPDGSEDMCGNGLRCAALWAHRYGMVEAGDFSVSTRDGLRDCNLVSADNTLAIVRVNMGEARFDMKDLPLLGDADTFINQPVQVLDKTYYTTTINTGSTHSIVFTEGPVDNREFLKYGPAFENLPIYPERTSVLWTRQIGINHFAVRIWERGAGETLGCGTGACAAAIAAVVNEKAERSVDIVISSKGGDLTINWSDTIWMTGPAELVYEGEIRFS
jgi:diaminopimelate epimerase